MPHANGVLVSHVAPAVEQLGLSAGDMIVAADGARGNALVAWSLAQPVCSAGAASQEARREEAARSFFSAPPVGTRLTVRSPGGEEREVVVGAPLVSRADWLYCRDPLGRSTHFAARAGLRPDGVGVITPARLRAPRRF